MENNALTIRQQGVDITFFEGQWFNDGLRREALSEAQAAMAAEKLAGLPTRAAQHKGRVWELWNRDLALREYAEFPEKLATLALPVKPIARPVELLECREPGARGPCYRMWTDDAIKLLKVPFLGIEVASKGWAHVQRVNLDSTVYPSPASATALYVTIAALKQIVPENRIMILVDSVHEHPAPRRVDPYLVVIAGEGYYLIAQWK